MPMVLDAAERAVLRDWQQWVPAAGESAGDETMNVIPVFLMLLLPFLLYWHPVLAPSCTVLRGNG